jgi:cyclic pyranopterin phosphate synthase
MSLPPANALPNTPANPQAAGWTGYLRVIVNARCSLACSYCHLEGDPASQNAAGLDTHSLEAILSAAVDAGARKIKFLGGEPLLRGDLPQQIAALVRRDPTLDISLITGGVAPKRNLTACFDAGLSRANLSIHGWELPAFSARTARGESAFRTRNQTLATLLELGRPLKVNFVWRGAHDNADLDGLLRWAAGHPVLVAVLDDLSQPGLGPADVRNAVVALRGQPTRIARDVDPHSLPTQRLHWADGLAVEIKDTALGAASPWGSCGACPLRARCREGIHAVRLTHEGLLGPCMDREDLRVRLRTPRAGGDAPMTVQIANAIRSWSPSTIQDIA